MTKDRTFVIVGASLAGAKAAETLREEGFDGRIVLIGAEPDRPYERPPLSKEYLRGEAGRDKVYVHEEGWYGDHEVDLRLGRSVVSLDPGVREVELDDGERMAYDRLLLTTGARPNSIPVSGSDLDGVLALRSGRTATPCASAWAARRRWSWSGRGGSAPRSPPRRASSAST